MFKKIKAVQDADELEETFFSRNFLSPTAVSRPEAQRGKMGTIVF